MPSFDIQCKSNLAEVDNAVAGIMREVGTRFDFKGSKSSVERKERILTIVADDEPKLNQLQELLRVYFTRRQLDIKLLDFRDPQRAAGDTLRQEVEVKEGIDRDTAKLLTTKIKESKMKVQASIQGDEVRVTGKKRDDLQEAIAMIKKLDVDRPLQFVNFRD